MAQQGKFRLPKWLSRRPAMLITSAQTTALENWEKRKRRYNFLQGMRIPLLLLSAVAWMWLHSAWITALLILISVPLPWIAVVIGNGAGEPHDRRAPQVYKPQAARQAQQAALQAASQRRLGALPPASEPETIEHE